MATTELEEFDNLLDHSSRVVPLWVYGKPPFVFEVTPELLSFGGVTVGQTGGPLTVKLVNQGFSGLTPVSVTASQDYTVTADLPEYMKPGEEVEFSVWFTPTGFGDIPGTLTFTMKEREPLLINVTGQGVWKYVASVDEMLERLWLFLQRSVGPANRDQGPVVSISPTSVVFITPVEVGLTSDYVEITITNSGTEDLVITDPTISGDFEIIP